MRNILIVDDEAFARDAIVESISWKEYGIKTWSAASGCEALKKLSEIKVDLIITDIKMPGMDGLELLKQIKEKNNRTGVLMLSSYNEFELVRTAMQLGAMDYLFKPTMMPDSILAAVLKTLERLQTGNQRNNQESLNKRNDEKQMKKQLFLKLLHGEAEEEKEILVQLHKWNYHTIYNVYALNFTVVKYSQSLKKVFLDKTELMRFSVENVLGESILKRFFYCMPESSFHEYIAVLWSDKELGQDEGRTQITEMIYECLHFLKSYYQIEFEVGISSQANDLFKLSTQYLEAKEAAQRAEINYLPVCWYNENGTMLFRELIPALNFIRDNLGKKDLSLQMVADYIGISKNYFSRLFKETMQINFIEYVTSLRLDTARKLYLNSDLKIYEIAEKVGYSDWHYLYSLYKKNFGHSLSRERKDKMEL